MTIKDVDGMTVPLFFYTESHGSELKPSIIQKGYTIAIFYAEFHAFAFSEPGMRVEEPTNIKVLLQFPSKQYLMYLSNTTLQVFALLLDKLLALSDRV